ncbi:hemerythrin domain-containing protein [Sphingomonas sp. PAMC 26605]|uniref:hemerythrin domain-containing protein n=1 Tax=Sphingomonas sp. PAMC 26605 TaxID=1112214 RepID=UPI0012F4EE3C|nr:hemerythrin domain-containing protein [Sphingomonas sp. PAMC 26605]
MPHSVHPVRSAGWHVIDEIDVVGLVSDHAALDQLCDRLEQHADQLPQPPSPREGEALRADLRVALGRHVVREERLFARLFAASRGQPLCHALLDHVTARHSACLAQAEDIVAALNPEAGARLCPEAFGYMLRGFFQGFRQAMAFEELTLLTLGDERLTPAARAMLTQRLAASCG